MSSLERITDGKKVKKKIYKKLPDKMKSIAI